jgi:hypothetical protein
VTLHRALGLPLLLLLAGGCSKACKNDHPYVPYAIEDGGTGTTPSSAAVSASAALRSDANAGAVPMVAPSEDGQTIMLGANAIQAPAGAVFGPGALVSLCGQGQAGPGQDLLGTSTLKESARALPSVLFAGSCTGFAVRPMLPAGAEIGDPTCTPGFLVSALATDAVFVDQHAICGGHSAFSLPRRVALITGRSGSVSLRFQATLTEVSGSARIGLVPAFGDLDGDGIGDLSLGVSIGEGSAGAARLLLRYYDRPAGPTRDPEEPARSAGDAQRGLEGRVSKDPDGALRGAASLRELLRAVCSEGGAPVLSLASGPVSCGVGPVLNALLSLRLRAYLQQGDTLAAAAVLRESERGINVYDAKKRAELGAQFRRGLGLRELPSPRVLPAALGAGGRGPALAPMFFDERGGLVFRDETGGRRWDPETDAIDPSASTWSEKIVTKDGALRLIEAYDPCDGGRLRATLAPTGAGEPREVSLPLDADFGTRCARRGPDISVVALGEGPRGLDVLVQGRRLFLPLRGGSALASGAFKSAVEGVIPGGAASPDGKAIVVPQASGLLVVSVGKPAVFHDGAAGPLSQCVVSDNATHAACVQGAKLLAFRLRQ